MSIGILTLNKKPASVTASLFSHRPHFRGNGLSVIWIVPVALRLLGNNLPHFGAVLASEGMVVPYVVFAHVIGLVGNHKIFKPVIVSDSVDVVDDLVGQKLAANLLLHRKTVLKHNGPADGSAHIPVSSLPWESVLGPKKFSGAVSPHAPVVFPAQAAPNAEGIASDLRAFIFHGDSLHKRFI